MSEYEITLCNGQKKKVRLKACPFCEYDNPVIQKINYDDGGDCQYAAVCPSCGASTSDYEARGSAIHQWNMRARETIALPEKLLEEIKYQDDCKQLKSFEAVRVAMSVTRKKDKQHEKYKQFIHGLARAIRYYRDHLMVWDQE